MDGPLPEWITDTKEVTVREKILVICLMLYYMQKGMSAHYACVGVFKYHLDKVAKKKIKSIEDKLNDPELEKLYPDLDKRKYVILGNQFEIMAENLINKPEVTEASIEQIAENLYQEFFE
ncbi:MAG TPA: hypothetical protein VLH94_03270 [Spirochaetia bacterium]|nr:hypothetical protein [Spirochaetia bacterium]